MGKKIKFSTYTDDESMQEFFRRVLERPANKKNNTYLYHYTSIETVANIVTNKCFWLNSFTNMNDQFEKELLCRHNKAGRLYFTSFSKAHESLAMYEMYCNNDVRKKESGAVIGLSYEDMEGIINFAQFGENTDGIYADGKYPRTLRKFYKVDNWKLTNELIDGEIYCGAVAYYDPIDNKLYCGTVKNDHIIAPFTHEELLGNLKYKCWSYEEEVRLIVHTLDEKLDDNCCISVPIPDEIIPHIEVITSPFFNRANHKKELSLLKEYSVNVRNSFYQDCVQE